MKWITFNDNWYVRHMEDDGLENTAQQPLWPLKNELPFGKLDKGLRTILNAKKQPEQFSI